MARLGLNLAFFTGDPYADLVQLGREAEEAGYDCLMVPEGVAGNDALLCCYMLAAATSRIHIVPNVANIYLQRSVIVRGDVGHHPTGVAGPLHARNRRQPSAGVGGDGNRDGQRARPAARLYAGPAQGFHR